MFTKIFRNKDAQIIDTEGRLIDFEFEEIPPMPNVKTKPKFDRVGDWDEWARKMHDYIASFTVSKYGDEEDGFDLMCVTEPRVCIWNIMKYALRLWKGKGKIHDIHKICHYAQMAYTLSKGNLEKAGITNEKGD